MDEAGGHEHVEEPVHPRLHRFVVLTDRVVQARRGLERSIGGGAGQDEPGKVTGGREALGGQPPRSHLRPRVGSRQCGHQPPRVVVDRKLEEGEELVGDPPQGRFDLRRRRGGQLDHVDHRQAGRWVLVPLVEGHDPLEIARKPIGSGRGRQRADPPRLGGSVAGKERARVLLELIEPAGRNDDPPDHPRLRAAQPPGVAVDRRRHVEPGGWKETRIVDQAPEKLAQTADHRLLRSRPMLAGRRRLHRAFSWVDRTKGPARLPKIIPAKRALVNARSPSRISPTNRAGAPSG